MKYWPLLFLAACAPGRPEVGDCGVLVAGDYFDRFGPTWLTYPQLQQGVKAIVAEGVHSSDASLQNTDQACQRLSGYRVYTRQERAFLLNGKRVGGYTECWLKLIVVNSPPVEDPAQWQNTALAHELAHAIQGCEGVQPQDQGQDHYHANWGRDGIFDAINRANTKDPE